MVKQLYQQFRLPISYRARLLIYFGLLFLVASFFIGFYGMSLDHNRPATYLSSIEYLEDKTKSMTFLDIKTTTTGWQRADRLAKGYSKSTWWIRIKTSDLWRYQANRGQNRAINNRDLFLAVSNPTTEMMVLYVTTSSGVQTYAAGWGVENHQVLDNGVLRDEGFSYPVFLLPENMSVNDYVYIHVHSPYSNNYAFSILDNMSYANVWQYNIVIVTLFVGMMLAFGITTLIQFSSLKLKAHLFYVIYIVMLLLYYLTVMGSIRVYFPGIANFMIRNVASLALMMFAVVMQFFRAALETEKHFPRADKLASIFTILFCADIVLMSLGFRYVGNLIAIVITNLAGYILIGTAYLAISKKMLYARFLLMGWMFTLFFSVVFNARSVGLIPNNEFTLFLILIPIVLEAMLLSSGLAQYVKQLGQEKEDAVKLYEIAEIEMVSKESAFLAAQIKPHFLYNALNVIEALCYIDGRKAGELILDLSVFLQHSFDFRNLQKYIPFDEELGFIKAYVRIQQARFKDKLRMEYEIDDVGDLMLPPLLIQPLIENAIKHGIRNHETSGSVTLRVKDMSNYFLIEIEDDGEGMNSEQLKKLLRVDESTSSGGVGIQNIQKRLKMFYQTELMIISEVGKGTKVMIELPKLMR